VAVVIAHVSARPSGIEVVGLTVGAKVGIEVEVGSGPNQARAI